MAEKRLRIVVHITPVCEHNASVLRAYISGVQRHHNNTRRNVMLTRRGLLTATVALTFSILAGMVSPTLAQGRGPATRPQFQIAKIPIDPKLPTLWIIGDSTVRNGSRDDGGNGQWGWGNPIRHYFDETKLNVQNRAVGGTSSRSFQAMHWGWILEELKPGDYVIMQFGHNDAGTPKGNSDEIVQVPLRAGRGGRGAGAQPGAPAATQPVATEPVHTFGWYMRKYVTDAKEHGIVESIIVSPIPRNRWQDGTILPDGWVATCKEAAQASGAKFFDLNAALIKKWTALGQQKVTAELFPENEVVHPDWAGAISCAESVIDGLKEVNSPLVKYLKSEPPKDLKHPSGRAR
jgi:lysophospholipase L1-like esterase